MKIERVRLGEVLTLQREPVAIEATREYVSIGVRGFGRGLFHYDPRPGSEIGKLRFYSVQPDRLVVRNIKGWEGAVAVSSPSEHGCVASNRFLQYAALDSVDLDYLRHYLLCDEGLEQLQRASPGSADRNRTLSIKNFESIVVPLLAYQRQQAIVRRLGLYQIAQAAATAPSPVIAASHRSLSGQLLRGNATRLRDVLQVVSSPIHLLPEGIYNFLGVRWYGAGPFIRERVTGRDVAATRAFRVRHRDIIYNRLFAWKGSFGQIPPDLDGSVVSNEFPTFRVSDDRSTPEYIRLCLEEPSFWEQAEALSTGSTPTSRNRLKEEQFLDMSILLASREEQEAAVRRAELLRTLKGLQAKRTRLAQALLPAARNEVFSRFA